MVSMPFVFLSSRGRLRPDGNLKQRHRIVAFSSLPATRPLENTGTPGAQTGAIVSCTYGHDVSMSKVLIYFFYKLKEGLFLCF